MELLYIESKEEVKQHYVYIKDFNKLMFSYTKHKTRKHFCKHCLQCFYSDTDLENHKKDCIVINGAQAIEMSKEGEKVYFKNHHKQSPAPFVIYADFESVTQKGSSCQPSNQKLYIQNYQSHQACGFGYKVVCHNDKEYSKPTVIYQGEDTITKFIKSMFEEVNECQRVMRENFNKTLRMTKKDEKEYQKATHCHICGRKYNLNEKDNTKVRDHCHITGK